MGLASQEVNPGDKGCTIVRKAGKSEIRQTDFHSERQSIGRDLEVALKNSKGRYSETVVGILRRINEDIFSFLSEDSIQQMALPPMKSPSRELFRKLCEQQYQLTTKTRGNRTSRCLVIYKNQRTLQIKISAKEALRRTLKEFGVDIEKLEADRRVAGIEGHPVGFDAPTLDSTNVGYRLLEQMGWNSTNNEPLSVPLVIVKRNREGLK